MTKYQKKLNMILRKYLIFQKNNIIFAIVNMIRKKIIV